ncbi:Short-chain dehydrogenase [Pseudomonas cichorii]|uniref:Short-chain dehydrogenase n=1 Tax=Pseudomonas cichorii TaxID=36746 RepID=A0A3M4LVR9_PSECI|nr:SDR family NAD(P)-dependent oxidoreductase [Pseudomonas cichorii]RMQ45507.1 Short-chain dehydrogenase [Pseudomonas cichorii]
MNTSYARRIWLTGASSGIGLALAKELLDAGNQVALTARTVAPLQALADRYPGQTLLIAGDITDGVQVRQMGDSIERQWGALDTAILNAGTCEYLEAQSFDAAMIERVVRTNLLASSFCIQEALPLLRKGTSPHLLGVASAVTYLPLPRAEAYGASKAGLRYLFESLRLDLASENIDVTVISPGFVDTPLTEKNDFPMPMRWPVDKAAKYIAKKLERSRRPLEIAFPGAFILSLRLLAMLPARAKFAIGKRMTRTSASNKDMQ